MSNRPVELCAIVIIFVAKFDKVFASLGHQITVQFQVQVSLVRDQANVALLLHTIVPNQKGFSLLLLLCYFCVTFVLLLLLCYFATLRKSVVGMEIFAYLHIKLQPSIRNGPDMGPFQIPLNPRQSIRTSV